MTYLMWVTGMPTYCKVASWIEAFDPKPQKQPCKL